MPGWTMWSGSYRMPPIPAPVAPPVASDLLEGETQGFAIEARTYDDDANPLFPGGTVAVIDTGTPANDLDDVGLDASTLSNANTSAKMVQFPDSPYARWAPHNYFLNSGAPVTQNVTLVTGFVYTYGITGTGSLAGTSGASGTATAGSPVTFTATGTTGTFTVTGSPSTMWVNRGPIQVPYLPTTGSIRIGIPQSYDAAESQYGIWVEKSATNLVLYSDDITNAAWTKSNMTTAMTATGPDNGTNSATTLTASAGNATALQAITSGSNNRITSTWIKRRTGSGNIQLTQDNGGTWTTVTVTADWTRVSIASVSSTDPTVGIRIVTSADAVDVFGFQHETGTVVTSTIPTVGGTSVRAVDQITGAARASIPYIDATGTVWFDFKPLALPGQFPSWWNISDGTNSHRIVSYTSGGNQIDFFGFEAGGQWDIANTTLVDGTESKVAESWAVNDIALVVDGGSVGVDTSATIPVTTGPLHFHDNVNFAYPHGYLYTFVYLPRTMSDAEMQAVTT